MTVPWPSAVFHDNRPVNQQHSQEVLFSPTALCVSVITKFPQHRTTVKIGMKTSATFGQSKAATTRPLTATSDVLSPDHRHVPSPDNANPLLPLSPNVYSYKAACARMG